MLSHTQFGREQGSVLAPNSLLLSHKVIRLRVRSNLHSLKISIKAEYTDQKMKEKSCLLSCQNLAKGRRKKKEVGVFSHKTLKLAATCVLPKNELKPYF